MAASDVARRVYCTACGASLRDGVCTAGCGARAGLPLVRTGATAPSDHNASRRSPLWTGGTFVAVVAALALGVAAVVLTVSSNRRSEHTATVLAGVEQQQHAL